MTLFFARQDFLPLEVAVHHDNSRFVIIQCPNEYKGQLAKIKESSKAGMLTITVIEALLSTERPRHSSSGRFSGILGNSFPCCQLLTAVVRSEVIPLYEIIAGHRRKRGSELAGKKTMPVLVRELDDDCSCSVKMEM